MKQHGYTRHNLISTIGSLAIAGTAFSSHAAIVINEIDYDQPKTDTAEYIELYNSGTSSVSLDNYVIELINGKDLKRYRSIDLTGFSIDANDYFVVCGNVSLVANCTYSFTTTNSWFQNGAPDAVALYENGSILDSISYEGLFSPYTEGDVFLDEDKGIFSIGRIRDGLDTNNNALDFQLGCITPGTANTGVIGDCSGTSISAVPVPAAVWLFGSGLLGLVGFARRSQER